MIIKIKIHQTKFTDNNTEIVAHMTNYNKQIYFHDEFLFEILTFHEFLFFFKRIFFENKNSKNQIGFCEICASDIEKNNILEKSIYNMKYSNDYRTFLFENRTVVGEVKLEVLIIEKDSFTTLINYSEDSFSDKFFRSILNLDVEISMSTILSKLFTAIEGSNGSKLNAFKGFLYLVKYYSKKESTYSFINLPDLISTLKMNKENTIVLNESRISFYEEPKNNLLLMETPFYEYYKQILYFAISTYGKSIQNSLITPQRKISEKSEFKDFLEFANKEKEDILFANLESANKKPFFIAYLHEDKVVISFRGTLTVKEICYDLKFEYKQLDDGFCHEGILELAQGFMDNYADKLRYLMNTHSKSKLLLTGHSLGGSLSYIIGYLLIKNNYIDEIDLEVVAFSPAPVFSKNIAEKLNDNFITFTYSNDTVPLLSYGTFCDLKFLCHSIGSSISLFERGNHKDDLVNQIRQYLTDKNLHPKLYLGGRIYQFKKYKDGSSSHIYSLVKLFKGVGEIEAVLIKASDCSLSNEIVLDMNALLYHFPNFIIKAFDKAVVLNKYLSENEALKAIENEEDGK